MTTQHLLTIALLGSTVLSAYSWGQKGHDIVAYIAEQHLTPATKAKTSEIFGGKSIVYYSNWLDNASHTPEYAYSKPWHYKNIDADETYRSARIAPEGDIVRALTQEIEVLGCDTVSNDRKALALKMVIHFLGDIHQPMHLGRRSDLGGNRVPVKFFGNKTNLHKVWDSRILEAGHSWSHTEWQREIDRLSPDQEAEILRQGNEHTWANETYDIVKQIYSETPAETNIEYTYIAHWTPVIEQQLLKGGLRLADVLNSTFDPDYKGYYTPRKK
ncbi:MAG: S1/P1 nuclease [Muribaculaceae bacterium]|nr:S1/P1 nuclease [Muribaculaceae bacterium]